MGQSDVYMYLHLFSIAVFYSFLHLWYVAPVQRMLSWNNFKINTEQAGLTLPFHWNREGAKKKGWWFSCKLCNVVSYAEYWFIAGIHKPKPPCWDRIIGDVIITTSLYHGVITHCCTADCSCRSSVLCLATTIIPFCSKSFFFFFELKGR